MSLVNAGELVVGEGDKFLGQVLALQFVRVKVGRFCPVGSLDLLIGNCLGNAQGIVRFVQ